MSPTKISIQLADRSVKYPQGVAENLLVKVGNFVFPANFVILDMEEDTEVPLILGRPFLATAQAVVDMNDGTLTLNFGEEEAKFGVGKRVEDKDPVNYMKDIVIGSNPTTVQQAIELAATLTESQVKKGKLHRKGDKKQKQSEDTKEKKDVVGSVNVSHLDSVEPLELHSLCDGFAKSFVVNLAAPEYSQLDSLDSTDPNFLKSVALGDSHLELDGAAGSVGSFGDYSFEN
ncbi:uncharacterized protein LOC118490394 [Helianthus annuus]|uniref:uncharacterized protein LOC118490394 n=1 Tax=Helianthus annuus TaxID=4232 RepID=UPI001652BBDD|nr:uncharacterized protein LOC118490394 [Helianthus annuus]